MSRVFSLRSLMVGASVLASFSLMACGESSASPEAGGPVAVSFRLASSAAGTQASMVGGTGNAGAVGPATSEATPLGFSITSGSDAILVTKAQLVVKDVKLKSALAACATSSDDDHDDGRDDDDCPTLRVGPYLVDVPVGGSEGGRLAVPVPAGTYSAVRLSIHKVSSSDSADLAFRQTNPDFRGISLRLEGTYNGTPFIFTHDVNAKLDVPLSEPVTIGEGGDNVTVMIDMTDWFVKPNGGLYSPAEGNTPGLVRAKIQNNIRSAFRAFRDRNRDGKEDR